MSKATLGAGGTASNLAGVHRHRQAPAGRSHNRRWRPAPLVPASEGFLVSGWISHKSPRHQRRQPQLLVVEPLDSPRSPEKPSAELRIAFLTLSLASRLRSRRSASRRNRRRATAYTGLILGVRRLAP